MYAGPLVSGLSGNGWKKTSDQVIQHEVRTKDAARMYSMNLQNWRDDPFVTKTHSNEAIADLATGLNELTTSTETAEIEWGLRQLTYGKNK
jgi:hypothetical protein